MRLKTLRKKKIRMKEAERKKKLENEKMASSVRWFRLKDSRKKSAKENVWLHETQS